MRSRLERAFIHDAVDARRLHPSGQQRRRDRAIVAALRIGRADQPAVHVDAAAADRGERHDDVLQRAFGARATMDSYGLKPGEPWAPRFVDVPPAHRRFFRELPLVLDLHVSGTPYWVIHAGVHKSTPVEPGLAVDEVVPWLVEYEPWDLLWNGGHIEDARRLDRLVVFGHTPHIKPAATARAIATDTGCGLWESGALTAVVLPEGRFVSVS
jgi:hypothetical protein